MSQTKKIPIPGRSGALSLQLFIILILFLSVGCNYGQSEQYTFQDGYQEGLKDGKEWYEEISTDDPNCKITQSDIESIVDEKMSKPDTFSKGKEYHDGYAAGLKEGAKKTLIEHLSNKYDKIFKDAQNAQNQR